MSLIAEKISAVALQDMIDLFEVQPWLLNLPSELAELWDICVSREEQILIKSLISDFCIFDSKKELSALRGIDDQIQLWGLSPKSTWIVATANKDEVDGSTAGLQKLKNKINPIEEWHSRFLGNIPAAIPMVKNGQTVVLFDDFIGSGTTIVRKKEWLSRLLDEAGVADVKYYYVSFSGMQFGVDYIVKNTQSDVYTHLPLKKGITERYPPAEAKAKIDLMLAIESRLGSLYKKKKIGDYSLGYKKSEALYCGQNDNCPNNVFPILWWPILKNGNKFKTLLSRAG